MNLTVEDENGRLHAMNETIVEQLIMRGIVTERDEKLYIKEADIDRLTSDLSWMAVCDFCSTRPVCWDIKADSFSVESPLLSVPLTSTNGWAACETCGTLVERRDKEALLKRTFKHHMKGYPAFAAALVREHLELVQAGFWKHFKGIERITPRPFGH